MINPITTGGTIREGEVTRTITDSYILHNATDFVKMTYEYTLKMMELTPSAFLLFNNLVHNHMDYSNKLTIDKKDNSIPLTRKDIEDLYGHILVRKDSTIKQMSRRCQEVLLELTNAGVIDKMESSRIYFINPLLAVKTQKGIVHKTILTMFSEYKILEYKGKMVREIYNLNTQSKEEVIMNRISNNLERGM